MSRVPPENPDQSYLSPPRTGRELYRRFIESWLGDWMDTAQARFFRLFTRVCRSSPDLLRDAIRDALSQSVYHLLSRPRQICLGNLTLAAGRVWDPDRIRRFTRKIYEYWATAIVDFSALRWSMTESNWQQYIRVHNRHHVDWLDNRPNGFIAAGLHMGNWEFMGQSMALMGYPVTSIARRRRHSQALENELRAWRTAWGQKIIHMDESPRTMLRLLQDGEVLGIVADQYAGRDGIFTDFFGAPTAHYPGAAVLANRAEVPIVPTYCYREPNRPVYNVVYNEPIFPVTSGTREENNREVIRQLFQRFETYIRRHPEQWLWFHRKWRDKWLPQEHIKLLESAPYLSDSRST